MTVPTPADFTPAVRRKAAALLRRAGGLRPDADYPDIWWALPSSGDETHRYRVQLNRDWGWLTCTCPHGLNTGGGISRCYHCAAALMLLVREESAK